jgi:hypothetical protein
MGMGGSSDIRVLGRRSYQANQSINDSSRDREKPKADENTPSRVPHCRPRTSSENPFVKLVRRKSLGGAFRATCVFLIKKAAPTAAVFAVRHLILAFMWE